MLQYNTNCFWFTSGIIHLVRTQIFPKNKHFLQLIGVPTWAYQGIKNGSFSENCAYILHEWSLSDSFNDSIYKYTFPSAVINANITLDFKKRYRGSNDTNLQVSTHPLFSNFFKNSPDNKLRVSRHHYFQSNIADFGRFRRPKLLTCIMRKIRNCCWQEKALLGSSHTPY